MRFADLDDGKFSLDGESSLENWYRAVRTLHFETLSVGDLGRAVRQGLYLEYVLPLAIERLEAEPLAGDDYDGQLFRAVAGTDIRFLSGAGPGIRVVADRLIRTSSVDGDLRDLARELKAKLAG